MKVDVRRLCRERITIRDSSLWDEIFCSSLFDYCFLMAGPGLVLFLLESNYETWPRGWVTYSRAAILFAYALVYVKPNAL